MTTALQGWRMDKTSRISAAIRLSPRLMSGLTSCKVAIPVKLIVHPQPALFGAAAAFAREHGKSN